MPTVTIGFVPRERFSLAAESLQRIFDYTHIPFNLIVVDCNIPRVYWQQIKQVLHGRDNVKVIHCDHYLLPNQSKNLVIQEAEDEFLCLIENDNLVQEGWLSQLIAACEEYPADVAVPLIIEGPLGAGKVHFDDLLGQVQSVPTPDGIRLSIIPRNERKELDRARDRRSVQFMEQHCLLFRRSVFDRIGPYDEELNTRDEIDLSLALYKAGIGVVFEPKCEVHYIPPYPPRPDETDYFFMKWDIERAVKSRDQNHERTYPLISVPHYSTITSTSLNSYIAGSGAIYTKVSPAGKMSEFRNDFSRFTTKQQPFIAKRDDTAHHYALVTIRATAELTVNVYSLVGDGSPKTLIDSFRISHL